jgi:drug/metabolite transporter (DMT)-like permease
MVVVGAAFFGLNATVSKLVLNTGIDALQLTTIRATGAALGLFTLALVTGPGRLRVRRAEVPLLVMYGIAGFFFVPVLYLVAISRLPVGVGVLFEYTAPLLLALWVRFVQRRAVRPRLWTGLAASLAGLAGVAGLVKLGPGVALDEHLSLDPLGVAAALGAAALLVAYFLLGARGVTARDPVSLTAYAFGLSALAGVAVRPWWRFDFHSLTRRSEYGFPVWLLVIYVVIGGSIVPYLLFSAAMRHVPATSVGIVGMLEPVFGAAIAWLALGEHLAAGQLAGGVLILVGVGLAETARVRPSGRRAGLEEPAAQEHGPQPPTPEGNGPQQPAGETSGEPAAEADATKARNEVREHADENPHVSPI